MRGSPGPGHEPSGTQPSSSSEQPLQSLSRSSQASALGEIPPSHGPHVPPNSPIETQVCIPSEQAPIARRPGGPAKQRCTAPGSQKHSSSTSPSQSSSSSLQSPSMPSFTSATHRAGRSEGASQRTPPALGGVSAA